MDQPLTYDKSEIIAKIKDLLHKVATSPRIERYPHIAEIYDYLKANKQFVKDNEKFYSTLKMNAKQLLQDMVTRLKSEQMESQEVELIYKAIGSILKCVELLAS
jgi:hypothetical protein